MPVLCYKIIFLYSGSSPKLLLIFIILDIYHDKFWSVDAANKLWYCSSLKCVGMLIPVDIDIFGRNIFNVCDEVYLYVFINEIQLTIGIYCTYIHYFSYTPLIEFEISPLSEMRIYETQVSLKKRKQIKSNYLWVWTPGRALFLSEAE